MPVLELHPEVVDMGILVIGSIGNQYVFTIKNHSDKFHTVKIMIDEKLKKHFLLEPNALLLRPKEVKEILIRSQLG